METVDSKQYLKVTASTVHVLTLEIKVIYQ
jgi:hypothetical protein